VPELALALEPQAAFLTTGSGCWAPAGAFGACRVRLESDLGGLADASAQSQTQELRRRRRRAITTTPSPIAAVAAAPPTISRFFCWLLSP